MTKHSDKKKKQFPSGAWLAIGIALGLILGVVTDDIAVGYSVGITVGVIFEMFYGSLSKK